MIYIEILPFLLLLFLREICCHGDAIERSKLLLVAIVKFDMNLFANIPPKSQKIILRLNHTSADSLDSILNGCYVKNARQCEPIWVTNQRQKYDSAVMNWPSQFVFNDTWPTFSLGCVPIELPQQLARMFDWLWRPQTTLGIINVNRETITNRKVAGEFWLNISRAVQQRRLNVIVVTVNKVGRESQFLAFGPNFVPVNNSVRSINIVDINGVVRNILQLTGLGRHNDGNATLATLITTAVEHHVNLSLYNLIFISAVIGLSVILSCIIFIGAVKGRNGKVPKMNHQYNLGLNTTSRINGFLENEYLLNASDEDELFADALPQIQTSRQQ